MSYPGYPQQPSSYPGQPVGYSGQAGYPSPGAYPQPGPYPQSGSYAQPPYQGYPQQQAYPQQYGQYGYAQPVSYIPGPEQSAPGKKSPILGVVSLLIVAVAGVAAGSSIAAFAADFGQFMIEAIRISGGTEIDPNSPAIQALAEPLVPGFTAQLGFALAGFIGMIMGIVAMAKRRGRLFGLLALLVGIAVPFVLFNIFGSVIVPMLEPYIR